MLNQRNITIVSLGNSITEAVIASGKKLDQK